MSPTRITDTAGATIKPTVALVVPIFDQGGGVPAVAMFLRRIALFSGRYGVRVLSLASACNDATSWRIVYPASWCHHPGAETRNWSDVPFEHIGAVMPELEFQRYRPRAALTQALAGCDLVQVICGSPAWANAVVGIGKPVALQVATLAKVERRVRDARPRGFKDWWRKGMTAITDRLDDRALRHVDAIQVENPWMLEYAGKVNADRKVDLRYAPPGVDAQRLRPLTVSARMHDSYILCVGRFSDPRKNVGLLLEAYARLPTAIRDGTRLVLAGASPPPAFWQRANALGVRECISCVVRPDDAALLDLYQHARVFALPSDEEGLGVVVLEAMACGVPVIATRCGGPDGIITDGKDGYLVPRGDAAAMSSRLAALLQSPARNEVMGHAARATIEQRYDERIAGEVFLDMWDRLLQRRVAP